MSRFPFESLEKEKQSEVKPLTPAWPPVCASSLQSGLGFVHTPFPRQWLFSWKPPRFLVLFQFNLLGVP